VHNPCSHAVGLGSIQPATEMSTRNVSGGNGQVVCKGDNLTAIYESVV
jgi:hypothetical protein